jgi:hypothetical protein
MNIQVNNPLHIRNPQGAITSEKMVNRLIMQESLAEARYQEHLKTINKGDEVRMLRQNCFIAE